MVGGRVNPLFVGEGFSFSIFRQAVLYHVEKQNMVELPVKALESNQVGSGI